MPARSAGRWAASHACRAAGDSDANRCAAAAICAGVAPAVGCAVRRVLAELRRRGADRGHQRGYHRLLRRGRGEHGGIRARAHARRPCDERGQEVLLEARPHAGRDGPERGERVVAGVVVHRRRPRHALLRHPGEAHALGVKHSVAGRHLLGADRGAGQADGLRGHRLERRVRRGQEGAERRVHAHLERGARAVRGVRDRLVAGRVVQRGDVPAGHAQLRGAGQRERGRRRGHARGQQCDPGHAQPAPDAADGGQEPAVRRRKTGASASTPSSATVIPPMNMTCVIARSGATW